MDEDETLTEIEFSQNLKFNFLNSLNLSEDVIRQLSRNLTSIVKGSNVSYLTPLGKHNDPNSLLSEVDKIIDKYTLDGSINSNLSNLESSNKLKFGPRSIAKPWSERRDNVKQYYKNDESGIPFIFSSQSRLSNLRPISVANSIKKLKNNSNSGLPYFTRKGSLKSRLESDYNKNYGSDQPCVLFTRTQEAGKTRTVFGYPVYDTIKENRYYIPLLNYQKEQIYRNSLKGPGFVDDKICNLILAKRQDQRLLSIDFSGFDTTITTSLQKACFNYIKDLFQPKYHKEIDEIFHRFNTIGLLTPDGVFSGSHGVPSGATFTNEVDSLAQFLIAKSVGLTERNFDIQGDDGAYSVTDEEHRRLLDSFKEYGLVVNEEKSYYDNNFIVYLQKLFDIHYIKQGSFGGIYPIYRALNRLVYQERFSRFEEFDIEGRDYYAIRAISILENCKYHPCFKEFVKFILSKDKYKLQFSQKSLSNYIKMEDINLGAAGNILNQHGDDIRGIKSFKTYSVIKELM